MSPLAAAAFGLAAARVRVAAGLSPVVAAPVLAAAGFRALVGLAGSPPVPEAGSEVLLVVTRYLRC